MDYRLCFGAKYCRNREIMCTVCKFQDKYYPVPSQTTAHSIIKDSKFKKVNLNNLKEDKF